jgi:ABC-2 type transport system permease protein
MKTKNLHTLRWLIQREFWEHKGAFLWAPLIFGTVMSVFCFMTLVLGVNNVQFNHISFNVANGGSLDNDFVSKMVHTISNGYLFISAPIFFMLSFVVFFYCLNGLYDDRRDRSILFWKSLPISDRMTVLSKLAMATIVAPLITTAIAVVTSLLILLMGCIALAIKGVNLFGMLLSSQALYLAPIEVVGMLPVYLLWALPTIGWLLMVSSWARSKVFLWAVGVPALSAVFLLWASKMFGLGWDIGWYVKNIVGRLLLSVFPGGWMHMAESGPDQSLTLQQGGVVLSDVFTHSWEILGNADIWVGAVAGAAMICVAIYMRRWREEA